MNKEHALQRAERLAHKKGIIGDAREPWRRHIVKCKPILGPDGEPLKTPPINKDGFWRKPKFGLNMIEVLYGKKAEFKRY